MVGISSTLGVQPQKKAASKEKEQKEIKADKNKVRKVVMKNEQY